MKNGTCGHSGQYHQPESAPMGSKPSYSLTIPDISQIPDISRRRYQINHQTHDESPRNGCHERACGHPPLASSGGRGGLTSGAGSITEEASRVWGKRVIASIRCFGAQVPQGRQPSTKASTQSRVGRSVKAADLTSFH